VTAEDLALEDRLELAYWRLHQLRRAERVAEMEAERGLR
jgi:hypothetical protein